MNRRLKQILAVLMVNAILLLLGVVVLEAGFGGWFRSRNLNRLNLVKNCVRDYDVSKLYHDANPIIRYSRDQYGLRGSHRDPAEIDILTVGGSTTDQRFIRDGETWQDVLQSGLQREGVDLVVGNAGVDGQSSYGHIKNFDWWFPEVPGLSPAYVVFYVGLNDFYREVEDVKHQLRTKDQLLGEAKSLSLKEEIRRHSVLWQLVKTLRGAYVAVVVHKIGHRSIQFDEFKWVRSGLQTNYAFMDSSLEDYAGRLRILAERTEQLGAKPIFVSQPCRWFRRTPQGIEGQPDVRLYGNFEYNGVDLYHMMRRLDQVTHAVAAEKSALFVDLANCDVWTDDDYYDFAHMTPSGARKVGEQLAGGLMATLKEKQNGNP